MKRLSGHERRTQIIDTAYSVILRKGLAGAATRDVTRQIGVGAGLLHHYFNSWDELRAEVVRTFVKAEIEDLNTATSNVPPERVIQSFVDWMTSDPEFRFWKLWLDACDEARRDPELAKIIRESQLQWHNAIVNLITRVLEEKGEAPIDTRAPAWRISAMVDGLMGILVVDQSPLDIEMVKSLLLAQVQMELRQGRSHF